MTSPPWIVADYTRLVLDALRGSYSAAVPPLSGPIRLSRRLTILDEGGFCIAGRIAPYRGSVPVLVAAPMSLPHIVRLPQELRVPLTAEDATVIAGLRREAQVLRMDPVYAASSRHHHQLPWELVGPIIGRVDVFLDAASPHVTVGSFSFAVATNAFAWAEFVTDQAGSTSTLPRILTSCPAGILGIQGAFSTAGLAAGMATLLGAGLVLGVAAVGAVSALESLRNCFGAMGKFGDVVGPQLNTESAFHKVARSLGERKHATHYEHDDSRLRIYGPGDRVLDDVRTTWSDQDHDGRMDNVKVDIQGTVDGTGRFSQRDGKTSFSVDLEKPGNPSDHERWVCYDDGKTEVCVPE